MSYRLADLIALLELEPIEKKSEVVEVGTHAGIVPGLC